MSFNVMILLLSVVIFVGGVYIHILLSNVAVLRLQLTNAKDMILSMAKELQKKGSTNVAVSRDDWS